jgi:DNA-binding LacI/PurR family transcriptional regulator
MRRNSGGAEMSKAPTILDVARVSGVSKSTVSNVIRGADNIGAETRVRVQAAIEQLGYRPNVLARQLVKQRSTIVGVVIGALSNPFHAEMTEQIERHAASVGYQTMFVSEEDGVRGVENLLDYRSAGIVFLAYSGKDDRIRALVEKRVPAVFVSCTAEWGDVVVGDDRQGGLTATEHLLSLGHRRVAHVTDPAVADAADRAREEGYRSAMAGAGLKPIVLHWSSSDVPAKAARKVALEDVFKGTDRPSAVFCSNDFGAIKILDLADRLGISVPRDLSVVGFDGIMTAGLSRINLTTIAQPQAELAARALAVLSDRIQGSLNAHRVCQLLDVRLVVRGSTSRPGRLETVHRVG